MISKSICQVHGQRSKNMASRFASSTQQEIEKMLEDKDSENTDGHAFSFKLHRLTSNVFPSISGRPVCNNGLTEFNQIKNILAVLER